MRRRATSLFVLLPQLRVCVHREKERWRWTIVTRNGLAVASSSISYSRRKNTVSAAQHLIKQLRALEKLPPIVSEEPPAMTGQQPSSIHKM